MKFFIRTNQLSGSANLYVRISRPKLNVNLWINTMIEVDIKSWNDSQKSIKALTKYFASKEGAKVQTLTSDVENAIKKMFKNNEIKSNDDKELIEQKIRGIVNYESAKREEERAEHEKRVKKERQGEILPYLEQFVHGMESGETRKRSSNLYAEGSINNWRSFARYCKEFIKPTMTFKDITRRFADSFVGYLEKQGLMVQTINKNVCCFRRLCRAAAADGINDSLVSIEVWCERTAQNDEVCAEISLSDDEINSLYSMELSDARDAVRDLFLLGYWSGQRYSDFSSFGEKNFTTTTNGTHVITLKQKKTKTSVIVPIIDERVHELCEKYSFSFPSFSRCYFDTAIKEIFRSLSYEMPSLREWVPTTLTKREREKETRYLQFKKEVAKGRKLDRVTKFWYKKCATYAKECESGDSALYRRDEDGNVLKMRWQMVSAHTTRRSLVTSLYDAGLDMKSIMSVSGHSSLRNAEKYLKRGKERQAEMIAEKLGGAKVVTMRKQA